MLNPGEQVHYSFLQETDIHSAKVISMKDDTLTLCISNDAPANFPEGLHVMVSNENLDFHAEVFSMKGTTLKLRMVWSEKREYFRVDDIFPLITKKVRSNFTCRKSRIFSGFSQEVHAMDLPDDSIHPQLWKMLVDISAKLSLVLERLLLESEGMTKAENKKVNVSAAGIRFSTEEKIEVGDVIEVKMLLPACPPVGILTYGDVTRVLDLGNGEYEVALQFTDMDDEVRDELIQYALKRQREIIRKQREQRGNNG
jgi:hypothetical protein